MIISLYTSRVILKELGVEDYGIYNAVGGLVGMFTMLSGTMTSTVYRFLSFEIGKGSEGRLKETFSTALFIQLVLSIIILVLLESIGIWFLKYKMIIPDNRLIAAYWVLQCSIILIVSDIIFMPFKAVIIAHEMMNVFAYFSIAEALMKLILVFILVLSPIDILVFFAILQVIMSLLVKSLYCFYGIRTFQECSLSNHFNKEILRNIAEFTGWNYVGYGSYIVLIHGNNLLLNLFFGPALNAARGISAQVGSAVSGFSDNVMTAVKPQIIKSYAAGDKEYLFVLIGLGTRMAFYITLLISVPLLLNTEYILSIWLYEVPKYAVELSQLSLIYSVLCTLSIPLYSATMATGNIKWYQIIIGGLYYLSFLLCYVCFTFFHNPLMLMAVLIVIELISYICRLCLLKKLVELSLMNYIKNTLSKVIVVLFISILLFLIPFRSIGSELMQFIVSTVVCISFVGMTVLLLGCTKEERYSLREVLKNRIL